MNLTENAKEKLSEIKRENNVIVIGHKNPDTDSICAAIAYADLKNKSCGSGFEACRAGDISEETQYVLNRFGKEAPRLCKSVSTQVQDLETRYVPGMREEESMRKVWDAMKDIQISAQPIVDKDGYLKGIITLNDIAKRNMDAIQADDLLEAHTPVKNILDTIDGELLAGTEDRLLDRGKIVIGAAGADSFESVIDEDDIVLVSDRYELQSKAIDLGASCLIVCMDADVSDLTISKAVENECVVIRTTHGTYETSRLLIQSIPVKGIMTTRDKLVTFHPETPLDEVANTMKSVRHIYFPIEGDDRKYLGLISRRNLMNATGKKLILVDHNEKTQCVDGFEDAEILEIIDHHRLADIQTAEPLLFRNQPVGCTCTIIYQMYQEKGIEIDKDVAGLMLSAILSDTLCLRSPTCTDVDKEIAAKLAEIVGVECEELADEMFAAGENLDGKSAEDICYQDYKIFTKGDVRFGVGQASFMSEKNLAKAKDMLLGYLPETLEKDSISMVFFMLTSVRDQGSYVIYAGEGAEDLLKRAFSKDVDESGTSILLDGVVSRKKQMIPAVMDNL